MSSCELCTQCSLHCYLASQKPYALLHLESDYCKDNFWMCERFKILKKYGIFDVPRSLMPWDLRGARRFICDLNRNWNQQLIGSRLPTLHTSFAMILYLPTRCSDRKYSLVSILRNLKVSNIWLREVKRIASFRWLAIFTLMVQFHRRPWPVWCVWSWALGLTLLVRTGYQWS